MPLLQLIPFKKELVIGLLVVLVIGLYTYYWYDRGYEAANQDSVISQLKQEKADLELKLATTEATTIVVTEYRDKIVEVEKKVPIYVKTVEEIFSYDDSIIIPDSLARLHDDMVCEGKTDNADPACGTYKSSTRVVTLGQFSKAVISNYGRCQANAEQLKSLSKWVTTQHDIINKN